MSQDTPQGVRYLQIDVVTCIKRNAKVRDQLTCHFRPHPALAYWPDRNFDSLMIGQQR